MEIRVLLVVGVRYQPGRRPVMKLQPPLYREDFFFSHRKIRAEGRFPRAHDESFRRSNDDDAVDFIPTNSRRNSVILSRRKVGGLYFIDLNT